MMRCEWRNMGRCVQAVDGGKSVDCGACPYRSMVEAACECSMFVAHDDSMSKCSAFQKRAAWADVAMKADMILATDGVEMVRNDPDEVECLVMSGQLEGATLPNGDFVPITDGGPYDVILSKKSWEKKNVGGWVQAWFCECLWGNYHGGAPGPGWQGRFCSHAYAALIYANQRARSDFMGDRRASKMTCRICGSSEGVSPKTGMCRECETRKTFNDYVAAVYCGDRRATRWLVANADDRVLDRISAQMTVSAIDSHSCVAKWNGYSAVYSRSARRVMAEQSSWDYSIDEGRFEYYNDWPDTGYKGFEGEMPSADILRDGRLVMTLGFEDDVSSESEFDDCVSQIKEDAEFFVGILRQLDGDADYADYYEDLSVADTIDGYNGLLDEVGCGARIVDWKVAPPYFNDGRTSSAKSAGSNGWQRCDDWLYGYQPYESISSDKFDNVWGTVCHDPSDGTWEATKWNGEDAVDFANFGDERSAKEWVESLIMSGRWVAAQRKVATRNISAQEDYELEHEWEGKPLMNASRLRYTTDVEEGWV